MKTQLLYKDRDVNHGQVLPWNAADLIKDLQLKVLFSVMAGGDEYLLNVCQRTILLSTRNDLSTIAYRQQILKDCLKNEETVRRLYDISVASLEVKKTYGFGIFAIRPSSILSDAITGMELFVDKLHDLRGLVEAGKQNFTSDGFLRFFGMLETELKEDYINVVQEQLNDLRFRDGILMSARLDKGNKGNNYILHRFREKKQPWYKQVFSKGPKIYSFDIHPRDESGIRALTAIKDNAINDAANDLAQSCDHIMNFFGMLRYELAFYVGCLNLEKQLKQIGLPVSFPLVTPIEDRNQSFAGLYDICLALSMNKKIVSNDLNTNNRNPVMITGANKGGKSTFLRSIGVTQLMAQSGIFIPAEYGQLSIYKSIITHFKREEDTALTSGKFDEELSRMQTIVSKITSAALILFNESFASTNEKEGSEIAAEVVTALVESGIQVFFVTHLYSFAYQLFIKLQSKALFLRAERDLDQVRSFKLREGKPLETSFAADVYDKIFKASEKRV